MVLWIIYTHVHGLTSYDETRPVLGRTTLFWGMLLSAPPNLMVALGLAFLHQRLAKGAISPPFFVPLLGAGLILLAPGNRSNSRVSRQILNLLMLIGISALPLSQPAPCSLEKHSKVVGEFRF